MHIPWPLILSNSARQRASHRPGLEPLEDRTLPATFTVLHTGNSGTGSLRWAINQANLDANEDTIAFNIRDLFNPLHPYDKLPTIAPIQALPTITMPVTIDATTQPMTHRVELNGANAAAAPLADASGLVIAGGSAGSPGCTVRGLVINRFHGSGIVISRSNNRLEGNFIGTDKTGAIDRGNQKYGIYIASGSYNVIGGITDASRNVISGNDVGIFIGAGAPWNAVYGNYIGTNVNGTTAVPNDHAGVRIQSAHTLIGAPLSANRNVISGNGFFGVQISGSAATDNAVLSNYIGTDKTGTAPLPNGTGVFIQDAPNNVIGGNPIDIGTNVISGNLDSGVSISGSGAAGNQVRGNYIGTDFTGTIALANGSQHFGVKIEAAPSNTIGGTPDHYRNIISGNTKYGVFIDGTNGAVDGNKILGNYIGTDRNGFVARSNGVCGVWIQNASGVIVGGDDDDDGTLDGVVSSRNIISGNGQAVEMITDPNVSIGGGNRVLGNFIGTAANGVDPLGNTRGIKIEGSDNNKIGGIDDGAGNTIAFNNFGVSIEGATGNAILRNFIFSNAGLGIDLGFDGVTPNDTGDDDSGPNKLQNFPELISATTNNTSVTITGKLKSKKDKTYTVEFFASLAGDASGFGEGQIFLGRKSVTTIDNGNGIGVANFMFAFQVSVPAGYVVTATATDPNNNTSEFSKFLTVQAA